MNFVPLVNANAVLIFVDSAGTDRVMTAYWVGGQPEFTQDPVEVTAISDVAKRNIIGLADSAMSFNLLYDSSGTASPYYVCNTLRIAATATAKNVRWYQDGTASTKPIITIPARLTAMNFGGGVGERLTLDVTFVADGAATFGTV